MRFRLDGHAEAGNSSAVGPHVIDAQVDQRLRRVAVKQQPDLAEPEESEPGRVKPADDLAAEHAGIEGNGTVQVVGVLGYLVQFHGQPRSPGKWIASLRN